MERISLYGGLLVAAEILLVVHFYLQRVTVSSFGSCCSVIPGSTICNALCARVQTVSYSPWFYASVGLLAATVVGLVALTAWRLRKRS